ncbi:transcriptional regulator [Nocardiopsis terrae]|uniref:DNA-binding LacI/PurR family transcriptional regulator n=1 Tax=Nocardiopsis terrae TaxID=372655 RepID=A0ABR9HDG8_9ACTN|nr:LacI family DNA-binding transcriptional regulator [Nocardiopsis terrae]MBE1457072.1 DNA-binding LacI/PurR family transcriptional regulator [Nocardiopsis terrae]GHC90465.1 transcriptional regulator [Nocardiopsis terrae]
MTKGEERRAPRPTIVDVAAAAGVSKSLVSLALRGEHGVSEATSARILAAAERLGYRSNMLARGLVQGRTMLLGVLLTDLANPYHTEVVSGVEESAEERGFTVLLAHGRRDRSRLTRQLDALLQLNVDGVVVVSSWLEPEVLAAAARRVPVVMVGRPEAFAPGVDTVANDDRAGAEAAVRHLADLGHERIAHLAGTGRPASRARAAGYRETMRALGLAGRTAVHGVGDPVRGRDRAAAALLGEGHTAVFAVNDLAALAVLDRAHEAGRAAPGGVSVVGYDNTSLAETVRPRLTSVDQPRLVMGRLATGLLLERMGGRTGERHEVLTPSLVVRGSTAAPPRGTTG